MSTLPADHPIAALASAAVTKGDLDKLRRLLKENEYLATAQIDRCGELRTLLHVATDWPGHHPFNVATVKVLIDAGADVNARFAGRHTETPLHWAASSDDVDVLDALIDAGADLEARGAVIGGGTPLSNAVAFGQWRAARRLVERGAATSLREAAALGLMDRLEKAFGEDPKPSSDEVNGAFWYACHGGQELTAAFLLERGADRNWVSTWDGLTPLDAARRSGAVALVEWLRDQGASSATEPG